MLRRGVVCIILAALRIVTCLPMTAALEALLRVASVGLHGRDWTFVAPHSQATFMAAHGDNFFVL